MAASAILGITAVTNNAMNAMPVSNFRASPCPIPPFRRKEMQSQFSPQRIADAKISPVKLFISGLDDQSERHAADRYSNAADRERLWQTANLRKPAGDGGACHPPLPRRMAQATFRSRLRAPGQGWPGRRLCPARYR